MTSPRNFKSIEITACALTLILSFSSSPPPPFFSKFASAQALASLTVECLGESVCFSCPFWYQLLTGFRTHLSPQSNDLGCRSQAGKYFRQRKQHLLPSLFPKGRTAPGLKDWKTEQRNRQELDSKDQLEETR